MKTAILLGSTGLVGDHLLHLLLADTQYERIILPVRDKNKISIQSDKIQLCTLDEYLDRHYSLSLRPDDLYICLGTTINKAGSQEAFKAVDYELVIDCAEKFHTLKGENCCFISSVGANTSGPYFYLKVKGEVEDELKSLDFDSLSIMRPSLLLGDRKESRFLEDLGQKVLGKLSCGFQGPFADYRPIHALNLAQAMLASLNKKRRNGTVVYQGKSLFELLDRIENNSII